MNIDFKSDFIEKDRGESINIKARWGAINLGELMTMNEYGGTYRGRKCPCDEGAQKRAKRPESSQDKLFLLTVAVINSS